MAKRPARKRSAPRSEGPSSRRRAAPRGEDAQFVFRGTVLQRAAATFAEVPLGEATTAVRVEEILHGPEILSDYAGQAITVQLGPQQSVAEGQEYVFHTNGWMYGTGLAVTCVAVSPSTPTAVRRTRAALSARPSQAVKDRANRAELVVSGQVTQIRQAPRPPGAPITEHDPEWQEAVVRVDEVAQGAPRRGKGREIVVRFAASQDVRWAKAPKFSVGQEGVWMLGDKTKEGAAMRSAVAVPKDQYLVVEPEDYFPKEHGARVLSQIK